MVAVDDKELYEGVGIRGRAGGKNVGKRLASYDWGSSSHLLHSNWRPSAARNARELLRDILSKGRGTPEEGKTSGGERMVGNNG